MNKINFILENNKIEGLHHEPTPAEINEYDHFMDLKSVTIADLEKFVKTYQPDARLRDKFGLNVRVGRHIPPTGGPDIKINLEILLAGAERTKNSAYHTHIAYETIHPFTDGNGRSGRMLWLWQMKNAPLGFLHTFYYQTLSNSKDL